MSAMDELERRGLQHAISAEQLQTMLGITQAFCSWDASISTVSELMDRWPFLFSHALMGANKSPTYRNPERILSSKAAKGIFRTGSAVYGWKFPCLFLLISCDEESCFAANLASVRVDSALDRDRE